MFKCPRQSEKRCTITVYIESLFADRLSVCQPEFFRLASSGVGWVTKPQDEERGAYL